MRAKRHRDRVAGVNARFIHGFDPVPEMVAREEEQIREFGRTISIPGRALSPQEMGFYESLADNHYRIPTP
jgi:hypothetical protein